MDKEREIKFREAIEKILQVASTLKSYEWARIISIVNHHYSRKSSRVMLDDNDIACLESHLKDEIIK